MTLLRPRQSARLRELLKRFLPCVALGLAAGTATDVAADDGGCPRCGGGQPSGVCGNSCRGQCGNCRGDDPCRHHSAFVREMRCTCRDYVPPAGHYLHATMKVQISNGEAARMVLYRFDFYPGEGRLNPRGRRQLDKMAGLLASTTHPLIIQASDGFPALDKQRREHVAAYLENTRFPVPKERIVVGRAPSRGLNGVDAEIVYRKLLNLSAQSGGYGGSAGAGASGGSGSSGLGMAPSFPR